MTNFYDDYLNARIEKLVMPYVKYKRKIDPETLEQYYEKTINLMRYIVSNFKEDDYDYVFDYLKDKEVIVQGRLKRGMYEYENYRYNNNEVELPDVFLDGEFNYQENRKMLEEYNNESDLERKKQIRDKIAFSNIKFLYWIVNSFEYATGIDASELIGTGYIGLISAIEKYDLNKEGTFAEYAKKTIMGFILGSMFQYYDFQNKTTYSEVIKYRREIEADTEKENMSFHEIADQILDEYIKDNPNRNQYDLIKKFTYNVSDSLESTELVDSNDQLKEVLESEFSSKMKEDVRKSLEWLPSKYKPIVMDLYGFSTGEKMSYREVGARNGVSYQTVLCRNKEAIKILSENRILRTYRNNMDN